MEALTFLQKQRSKWRNLFFKADVNNQFPAIRLQFGKTKNNKADGWQYYLLQNDTTIFCMFRIFIRLLIRYDTARRSIFDSFLQLPKVWKKTTDWAPIFFLIYKKALAMSRHLFEYIFPDTGQTIHLQYFLHIHFF